MLASACDAYDHPAPLPVQPTSTPSVDAKAPIKIGVLHATTGGYAPLGVAGNEGLALALGVEQPLEVAGRKVVLVFEDTEGRPDVALSRVRELVERDKVTLLVGPTSATELDAIRDYVHSVGVPLLVTFPDTSGTTGRTFRIFWLNGVAHAHAVAARYAAQRDGRQRTVVVVSDSRAGLTAAANFTGAFEQTGGQHRV